jgi:hypothetical protein
MNAPSRIKYRIRVAGLESDGCTASALQPEQMGCNCQRCAPHTACGVKQAQWMWL